MSSGRGRAPAREAAPLRRRIAKNSKDYDALAKLALLTLKAGDLYEAKMILDKATEGGAPSRIWNLRGVLTFTMGYVQDAYDDFRKAAKQDAHNPYARGNLAVIFHKYGYEKRARSEAARVSAGKLRSDAELVPGARGVLSSLGVK